MPFNRREYNANPPRPQPPRRLQVDTPSILMNVIGRGLNAALPQDMIDGLYVQWINSPPTTANQDELRAGIALDWLVRTWLPHWLRIEPTSGAETATAFTALDPIRDLQTVVAAGRLVGVLSELPGYAEEVIRKSYSADNFYEQFTVRAARNASMAAMTATAGAVVADAVASIAFEMCLMARVDVILESMSAAVLVLGLDTIWPRVQAFGLGPGGYDVKRLNITELAPLAAEIAFQPVVKALQAEVCNLYIELCRLG